MLFRHLKSLMSQLGQSGEERVKYLRVLSSSTNGIDSESGSCGDLGHVEEVCLVNLPNQQWGPYQPQELRLSHSANLVRTPPLSRSIVQRRGQRPNSLRFLHTQRPIPVPGSEVQTSWNLARAFLAFPEFPVPSLRRAKSRYRLPPRPQLNVALLHKLGGIGCEIQNNLFEAHTIRQDDQITRLIRLISTWRHA
jgi:hypothetical protein